MTKTRIGAIFDRVIDGFGVAASGLLVVIMLAISIDVASRYFFRKTITGIDEITANLLLYITFLGTAWLLRRNGHIAIDILFVRLKPKAQAWLSTIFSAVGALVSLVLVWYGITCTLDVYLRHAVTPTVLEIPRAAIIIVIPIGSLPLLIQFLRKLVTARSGG